MDLYCHGLVDVEYNVTRMWNESIGLGHRLCNSGPHALEWNVDCSEMPCEITKVSYRIVRCNFEHECCVVS